MTRSDVDKVAESFCLHAKVEGMTDEAGKPAIQCRLAAAAACFARVSSSVMPRCAQASHSHVAIAEPS